VRAPSRARSRSGPYRKNVPFTPNWSQEWRARFDGATDPPMGLVRGRYSLLGERPDEGHLEPGFLDGRTTINRDTEIAIEMLCEHVHAAAERISARRPAEPSGDGSVVSLRRRG